MPYTSKSRVIWKGPRPAPPAVAAAVAAAAGALSENNAFPAVPEQSSEAMSSSAAAGPDQSSSSSSAAVQSSEAMSSSPAAPDFGLPAPIVNSLEVVGERAKAYEFGAEHYVRGLTVFKKAKISGAITEEEFTEAKRAMLKNLSGQGVVIVVQNLNVHPGNNSSMAPANSVISESESDSSDSSDSDDEADLDEQAEFDAFNDAVSKSIRKNYAKSKKRVKLKAKKAEGMATGVSNKRKASVAKRKASAAVMSRLPKKKAKHALLKTATELGQWKSEYEKVFGKRPAGRSANDIEWLKKKLAYDQRP
jgi:hypothetical protein